MPIEKENHVPMALFKKFVYNTLPLFNYLPALSYFSKNVTNS